MTAGGGAAAVGDESWLVAKTAVGLVTGRETGPVTGIDALSRHVVGGETEGEVDDWAGVSAGTAAGFFTSCCPKTKAETGTMAGRCAGMS